MRTRAVALLVGTALVAGTNIPTASQALEKVKVNASFVGLWDTSQPTFCKERGEFEKAGLDVQITSTRGGSETVQAVTAGGADIGYSPGTNAVLAAFMGGAKIRIISSEFIGQNDTYFYVPANSPIKTVNDIQGKTVAFPRPGGSSESILLALKQERPDLKFKMVATGKLGATHTMLMTGQIDVAFSFPPYGLDRVKSGKMRVVFSGDIAKTKRDITGRVNIASEEFVTKRRPVAIKFMQVLNKCIDWMYTNKAAARKMYAKINKIDEGVAEEGMKYYSRESLAFAPIKGLDKSIQQAIDAKFINKAPSKAQLDKLIDIVYKPKM